MRIGIITFSVPPFDYKSPWWWLLDNVEATGSTVDLIGPSGEQQFQRQELSYGTAHLLNIYAEDDDEWSERERVEFSVKTYVYLSKLHKRESFDRFVLADCSGTEPLISANLSVMAPTWIKVPLETESERGRSGSGLMETAKRTFSLNDLTGKNIDVAWPPEKEDWNEVVQTLTDV